MGATENNYRSQKNETKGCYIKCDPWPEKKNKIFANRNFESRTLLRKFYADGFFRLTEALNEQESKL
jgi:hypothetical protein